MNNINNEIESLHQNLIKVLNDYRNLPVGVIHYVLKDCFNEVSFLYHKSLQQEQKEGE